MINVDISQEGEVEWLRGDNDALGQDNGIDWGGSDEVAKGIGA